MSNRPKGYWGVVDMGSNGIRFSITDLNSDVGAGLPTLYLSRAGISLYNAQYSEASPDRQPIPQETIDAVTNALRRFQRTCYSFGMEDKQIQILATEATRVAPNSTSFIEQIRKVMGQEVGFQLLAKEDEGRIGALGIASSLPDVQGLVMDLGGGSTQLSWLLCKDGDVKMPQNGSVSMPYGAAALSRRLNSAGTEGMESQQVLRQEILTALNKAVKELQPMPEEIQAQLEKKQASLYVSGGGLRGWGYILMSMHPVQPYPIPMINGFRVDANSFFATPNVEEAVKPSRASQGSDVDIFRVSERRVSQVPAVAFLVGCLEEVLNGQVGFVNFCQGGVREGFLYQELPTTSRKVPALWQSCSNDSSAAHSSLPGTSSQSQNFLMAPFNGLLKHDNHFNVAEELMAIPQAVLLSLHLHASLLKDLRAACALRSTTTGALAAAHAVSHFQRAALAIALTERWGGRGALSPTDTGFYDRLQQVLELETGPKAMSGWWCILIGRLAAVIAEFYPAGGQESYPENSLIQADWDWLKPQQEISLVIKFPISNEFAGSELDAPVWTALSKLERCSKKKNWPCGNGMKLSLKITVDGKECKVPKKSSAADEDD